MASKSFSIFVTHFICRKKVLKILKYNFKKYSRTIAAFKTSIKRKTLHNWLGL